MNIKKLRIPSVIIALGIIVAAVSCLVVGITKKPTVSAHDFNFSVTYRLGDDIETLRGVYKCRFSDENSGASPDRYYIAEHTGEGTSMRDGAYVVAQKDGFELCIIANFNSSYLMGDTENEYYDASVEEPYFAVYDEEGCGYEDVETVARFDAEIISCEYPEPIENSFEFAGFSFLYAESMLAMLLVGVLTIIACVVFVRKKQDVSYNSLDSISIALNFIIAFAVLPFITVVVALMPLTVDEEALLYQVYLCVPAMIAFTVAASVAFRRNGFTKSGLLVQLACPVLFFASIFVESLIYNVFS